MAPLTPKENKKKKKKKNIPPIPPIKRKINKKKKRVANRAYARARDKPSILKQTKKRKTAGRFFSYLCSGVKADSYLPCMPPNCCIGRALVQSLGFFVAMSVVFAFAFWSKLYAHSDFFKTPSPSCAHKRPHFHYPCLRF